MQLYMYRYQLYSEKRQRLMYCIKQRVIQDQCAGREPPRFEKNYRFVFVNFDCITRI